MGKNFIEKNKKEAYRKSFNHKSMDKKVNTSVESTQKLKSAIMSENIKTRYFSN